MGDGECGRNGGNKGSGVETDGVVCIGSCDGDSSDGCDVDSVGSEGVGGGGGSGDDPVESGGE